MKSDELALQEVLHQSQASALPFIGRNDAPRPYPKITMRGRKGKSQDMNINVRFGTPEDYARVKRAAATTNHSMNLFITMAALKRARNWKKRQIKSGRPAVK